MPSCLRPDQQSGGRNYLNVSVLFYFNPLGFLFFLQEEASKAMGKKTLGSVTNEKETESQAMDEKAGGHV